VVVVEEGCSHCSAEVVVHRAVVVEQLHPVAEEVPGHTVGGKSLYLEAQLEQVEHHKQFGDHSQDNHRNHSLVRLAELVVAKVQLDGQEQTHNLFDDFAAMVQLKIRRRDLGVLAAMVQGLPWAVSPMVVSRHRRQHHTNLADRNHPARPRCDPLRSQKDFLKVLA
jgi:hypothetical protein